MAKNNKFKKRNITIEDLAGMTKRGFDHVDEQFNGVRTDITGLKSDVKGLKSDVKELKTDVSGLKDDVKGLKSDVKELKTDVSGLKDDVSELKTDMTIVKSDIGELKEDVRQGNKTVDKIYNLLDKNLKTQETLKQEFIVIKHQGNKIKEVLKDKLGVEIQ